MCGREYWIRTNGILLPKQALYQAELTPDINITKELKQSYHKRVLPPSDNLSSIKNTLKN